MIVLFGLGVLHGDLRLRDLVGKLVLQSVPVGIGASVAMSAFGEEHRLTEARRKQAGYWGALGMATAGATLFGFTVAGTEEPLMLANELTAGRAILLVLLSIVQVIAIVYAVDFKQRPSVVGTRDHMMGVLREGVSTYAVAVLVGLYFLWSLGTIEAGRVGLMATVYAIVITGFITSLGAAAAELLI